jgi:phenylpyruvate tautomerase PptA (4-oxalocrotonate tautomerase family)
LTPFLRWQREVANNRAALTTHRIVSSSEEPSMPLVRIDLLQGTSPEFRKALGEGVHQAMIEALQIPPDDRFQVITEHAPGGIAYDPQYLGIHRNDKVVFVQITASAGRKPLQKRKLYKRMAEILQKSPGLEPANLLINLVEVVWENWSFGNGEAQYMDQ